MSEGHRIALLIDADNSSSDKIGAILGELASYGECNIRRAYGNWTKAGLKGWAAVLHERAIRPVQQYDYSRGKNASDMALVVDAMALLYTDQPDAFAIVSSDADFTPLVMHLREKGCAVYGFGQKKTPEPFVSACSRFLFTEQLDEEEGPEEQSDPEEQSEEKPARRNGQKKAASPPVTQRTQSELRKDARLVQLLRTSVGAAADEDGWATISAVGQRISNQSSFDSRNYGYASLTKLVRATGLFELRGEGSALAVRDHRRR